ncbi:response regulator transcription factor [Paenibacillus thermotolerans]|uniref:response regulator transcription factor n=1 Tax=Paenibacillus thermotolerans TaxID=3027807 RepID=UPI00236814F5|nr:MULTISPECIES: response regulator transcription factor [unclassified Paenibacillus]
MRVLWVEDEKKLLEEGAAYLRKEGFEVLEAGSAAETLKLLQTNAADIVLLDWLLPDGSGIDVCRQIQTGYKLPVIMITAKTDEFDKVLALEIGADDYIVKPFGMREVVARIRAVSRRTGKPAEAADESEARPLIRGELRIDLQQHAVHLGNREIFLTPTEFTLLCTLARRPGRVFTRSQLMDAALGEHFAGFERTIDSHIRNLRKKLEEPSDNPKYIVTVFGIGYKFGDPSHE